MEERNLREQVEHRLRDLYPWLDTYLQFAILDNQMFFIIPLFLLSDCSDTLDPSIYPQSGPNIEKQTGLSQQGTKWTRYMEQKVPFRDKGPVWVNY